MAEGTASQDEYRSFLQESLGGGRLGMFTHVALWAVRIVQGLSGSSPEGSARSVAGSSAQALGPGEPAEQCKLLRDVLGNPYRPLAIHPPWRTPTVLALAQAAYDDCKLPGGSLDPARLAVLADALEEVGADGALLDHLREPGPHVRGCWPLDLVLGKQ
jgi:hypothetical protein